MSEPRHVMVVDDDDDLRETLVDALQMAGFETSALADGAEALQALRAGVRPDLMLLDLMMPNMSGWEVYDAIAGMPELAELPIVIMTATRGGDPPGAAEGVET